MKMIFIISPPYSTGRTHSMSRERAFSVASGCVLRRFPAAVARGSPSLSRLRRLPIDSQASRAPACGQSVTIYEFTACDQAADCAAALGGTRSPPPQAGPTFMTQIRVGRAEEPRSDWRRAVAAVSERRVAEGRALYTQRSPAELYRGARSSERERYAGRRADSERSGPPPAPAVPIIRGY